MITKDDYSCHGEKEDEEWLVTFTVHGNWFNGCYRGQMQQ